MIRGREWSSCFEELKFLKTDELAPEEGKYTDAFNLVVEGLRCQFISGNDSTDILNELMTLMPDHYDVDQMLQMIHAIDDRPCSLKPVCDNPGCNHVVFGDLRL